MEQLTRTFHHCLPAESTYRFQELGAEHFIGAQ